MFAEYATRVCLIREAPDPSDSGPSPWRLPPGRLRPAQPERRDGDESCGSLRRAGSSPRWPRSPSSSGQSRESRTGRNRGRRRGRAGVRGRSRRSARTVRRDRRGADRTPLRRHGADRGAARSRGRRLPRRHPAHAGRRTRPSPAPGRRQERRHAPGPSARRSHPQPAGSPMVLATPAARIEVRGTEFYCQALPDRTDVSVTGDASG